MPTGNGGITQGLALRLTNMEQGRREVTANQFKREQMDALNEQRKAAADYRKALAEQKEAARQEKQISELQKSINVKGLHPIYQDVAGKESAEFISRTIEGMKKVPNYTSSGEYLQDYDKVMAHQNMRIASSNNMFNGEKKVTQNADDYELQSDMYDALQKLDYPAFIKANGGTDYVMPDGNVQPKFNKAKVSDAMWKYATLEQPIGTKVEHLGGITTTVDVITPDEQLLEDSRNGHIQAIATSNMPQRKKIEYADKVNEVYKELKGSAREQNKKTFKDSRDPVADYAAKEKIRADRKAKEESKPSVSTVGNKTTITYKDAIVTKDNAPSGTILTYASTAKNTTVLPMALPLGAIVEGEDGHWREPKIEGDEGDNKINENKWTMTNIQYHILTKGKQKGSMVLYGLVKDEKGVSQGMKRWKMPTESQNAIKLVNQINGLTKDKMHFKYEKGVYTTQTDDSVVLGESSNTSNDDTAPTNTAPAGGGQKKTAPKAAGGGQRMKWNSTTHKMEAY